MHRLAKVSVVLVAYFGFVITTHATSSASDTASPERSDTPANTNCQPAALRGLQRLSPQGFAIYKAMKDKSEFMNWVTCDDVQLDLATAVHESVHNLTEERDAYPLLGGGNIPRPHEVESFFPPKRIAEEMAKNFDNGDLFIQTYLQPGSASSADNFMYLLDELNAFSHDLNSASKLTTLHTSDQQVDHRDGLAAMMAFLTAYARAAQKNYPDTWKGLTSPEVANDVQILWKQAETVMTASCGIPNFGTNDRSYLNYMCDKTNAAALTRILQRPPVCPVQCLSQPAPGADTGSGQ